MKLLITGDLHLRKQTPSSRVEKDFWEVCKSKLIQVLNIAEEEQCQAILQPGDFWDRPDPPKKCIAECIEILRETDIPILAIAGQHDMIGHNIKSIQNSALRILKAADLVFIINSPSIFLQFMAYGASFGQEIPQPERLDVCNILLVHNMIADKALYPGHKPISPSGLLKKYKDFDLIVCGDYHSKFAEKLGDRWIVNAGCLLRLTTKDMDHEPGVLIYDTESKSLEEILLDIAPAKEAFRNIVKPENTVGMDIEALVEKLKSQQKIGVDFDANLAAYIKENKVDECTVAKIDAVRESLHEQKRQGDSL